MIRLKFLIIFTVFRWIHHFWLKIASTCSDIIWKMLTLKAVEMGQILCNFPIYEQFFKLELTQRVRYLVYENHKMSCNSLEFWTYRNHATNNIYSLWLKHLRTNKVPVTSLYLPHPSYQALGKKKSWARARCWNSIIMKKILNLDQNMWACSFSNSSL